MSTLARITSSPLFVPVGLLLLAVVALFGLVAYLDRSSPVKRICGHRFDWRKGGR